MEISFAACGFSSQTVLVISIEKRWRPMLIITRPCFVAIGAACCGCSGKGVGLVGIVVPLAGIGSPTSMSLLGHSCQLPLSSAAGAQPGRSSLSHHSAWGEPGRLSLEDHCVPLTDVITRQRLH